MLEKQVFACDPKCEVQIVQSACIHTSKISQILLLIVKFDSCRIILLI